MSALNVITDALTTASQDLANLEASLSEANSLMAPLTTAIPPAAADEVSAAISELFSGHGQRFQQLHAQAQAVHQQFVQNLGSAANSYAATEEQNALNIINAPTDALFGRPLIGDGANGTAASPNGQPGGFLWGNGGNGFSEPTGGGPGGNGGVGGFLYGHGGNGGSGGDDSAPGTFSTIGAPGGNGGTGGWFMGAGGTGGDGGSGGGVPGGFGSAGGVAALGGGVGGAGGSGGGQPPP